MDNAIHERLDRLERENRRLRGGFALLLLAIVTTIFIGAANPIPDEVMARRFSVVSKDGNVPITLSSMENGAGMIMIMGRKKIAIVIGAMQDGRMIMTYNDKGENLVELTATGDGEGVVTTWNGKGEKLVKLGMTTKGEGVVTTWNGKGQHLVNLAATTGGEGIVSTLNGKGQKLVNLTATTKGEGMVSTLNGKGQKLVSLTTSNGYGAVATFDPTGMLGAAILQP